VESGEANLVALAGALGAEEVLTAVQPPQRILAAVKSRKGQLVVARDANGFGGFFVDAG
jgi:hypothetical protein